MAWPLTLVFFDIQSANGPVIVAAFCTVTDCDGIAWPLLSLTVQAIADRPATFVSLAVTEGRGVAAWLDEAQRSEKTRKPKRDDTRLTFFIVAPNELLPSKPGTPCRVISACKG